AVVSPFIPSNDFPNPQQVELRLLVNGQVRQNGTTAEMIWDLPALLAHAVQFFTLLPGDLIFTGTPAGVGPLRPGDELSATLAGTYAFRAMIEPDGILPRVN
ncbi:MAG: fumarylacetoacetate hydrolase family protein, partial [Spirochaetia bacterium]|nr:fumarylacetoacetate hydrolase family protein [Spirochaetia bacterium]